MGEIVDLGDYRRKKIEKQKGIDTRHHPSRRVDAVNASLTHEQVSKMTHRLLSDATDETIHAIGAQFGHIPNPMDIMDMPNVDYDAVRLSLATDPKVHAWFLDPNKE